MRSKHQVHTESLAVPTLQTLRAEHGGAGVCTTERRWRKAALSANPGADLHPDKAEGPCLGHGCAHCRPEQFKALRCGRAGMPYIFCSAAGLALPTR